jgi:hypothetical protein
MTTPYDRHKYNLLSFSGKLTKILAIGNSHLMELFYLPICATPAEQVTGYHIRGNTFVIRAFDERIGKETIALILDNDKYFASDTSNPNKTIHFLQKVRFTPSHIVLGSVNHNNIGCLARARLYEVVFPGARIICRCSERGPTGTDIASSCNADGLSCTNNVGSHQCVPSRGVIRGSEFLMQELLGRKLVLSQCIDTAQGENLPKTLR